MYIYIRISICTYIVYVHIYPVIYMHDVQLTRVAVSLRSRAMHLHMYIYYMYIRTHKRHNILSYTYA